jgi:hypothetical protein
MNQRDDDGEAKKDEEETTSLPKRHWRLSSRAVWPHPNNRDMPQTPPWSPTPIHPLPQHRRMAEGDTAGQEKQNYELYSKTILLVLK